MHVMYTQHTPVLAVHWCLEWGMLVHLGGLGELALILAAGVCLSFQGGRRLKGWRAFPRVMGKAL